MVARNADGCVEPTTPLQALCRPGLTRRRAPAGTSRSARGGLLLIGIAILSGCSGGKGEEPAVVTTTDEDGVEHVSSLAAQWGGAEAPWSVDERPVVEIGGVAVGPEYQLFRVAGVQILADGTIVVADQGHSELRFYDRAGNYLSTVGRSGEGPGEFRGIRRLYRCAGDTLVVEHGTVLSFFTDSGEFTGSEQIAPRLQDTLITLEGISQDCTSVLGQGFERTALAQRTVYWTDRSTGTRDTLREVQAFAQVTRPNGMVTGEPYGAQAYWTAGPGGAYIALGDEPAIHYYERNAGLRRVIRWSAPARAVESGDRNRFNGWRDSLLLDQPERADLPAPGEFRFPASKPFVAGLLVDDGGNVWIRAYPDDAPGYPQQIRHGVHRAGETWGVIDAAGRYLGELTMPAGLQVLGVHRRSVVGIFRDSLDVQHVRLHRVQRPGTGG
jgi:hypothetical protein